MRARSMMRRSMPASSTQRRLPHRAPRSLPTAPTSTLSSAQAAWPFAISGARIRALRCLLAWCDLGPIQGTRAATRWAFITAAATPLAMNTCARSAIRAVSPSCRRLASAQPRPTHAVCSPIWTRRESRRASLFTAPCSTIRALVEAERLKSRPPQRAVWAYIGSRLAVHRMPQSSSISPTRIPVSTCAKA